MSFEFKVQDISSLSYQERRECQALSYRSEGLLAQEINKKSFISHDINQMLICRAYDGNLLIGWGIITDPKGTARPYIMLYVRKKYRRKRIGTTIIKNLAQKRKQCVFYRDYNNRAFFNKVESSLCINQP